MTGTSDIENSDERPFQATTKSFASGHQRRRLSWWVVNANAVVVTSDRNAKENFAAVNDCEVLGKVASLPVTEWNYKTDNEGVQHIGPMAQDFQAAFQLDGKDDKHISAVDEGGVALAAIQGLNQKLQDELGRQDAENAKLKQQNDSLAKRLQELEAVVKQIEAQK